jgi:hypothetical protein
MKKMIFSILTLVFVSSAFAGNEGPQAAPIAPKPAVVAERRMSGGFFAPPDVPYVRSLQILENGDVNKVEFYRNVADPVTVLVYKLTNAQIARLQNLVAGVQEGKMIDPQPEEHGCMDAPLFEDVVYKAGTRIVIAQKFNCKDMVHDNATVADTKVIQALNKIEALVK